MGMGVGWGVGLLGRGLHLDVPLCPKSDTDLLRVAETPLV